MALEMVLPGIAGYWVDQQLGTVALFTLLGFALGSYVAMVHLIRMTQQVKKTSIHQSPSTNKNSNLPTSSSLEEASSPETTSSKQTEPPIHDDP